MVSQERAIATRRAVLVAAARVFEAKGYAAASINDILAEGEVTRGALYFHFRSKGDLARAIMDEQAAWIDHIEPRSLSPLQAAVDASYAFVHEVMTSVLMRASVRLVTEKATFDPSETGAHIYEAWADRAEQVFAQAETMGQLQPGWTPRELALMSTSYVLGIQLSTAGLRAHAELTDRVHAFWRAVLPTIARPSHAESVQITPPRGLAVSTTVG